MLGMEGGYLGELGAGDSMGGEDRWEERYRSLLYAISHDFGAPLRHVVSFGELLDESGVIAEGEEGELLTHMLDAGRLGQAMAHGLDRLSHFSIDEPCRRSIPLTTLVSRLRDEARLSCELSGDASVAEIDGDLGWVEHAVLELVANAREVARSVSARILIDSREVQIRIEQDAAMMSEHDWGRAREPFRRLGERLEIQHVGIGLTIADVIAARLGGRLERFEAGVRLVLTRNRPRLP